MSKILELLEKCWGWVGWLMNKPDPNDEKAVREFAEGFLGRAKSLVGWLDALWHPARPDFEWATRVLRTLLRIVQNDQAWALIWQNRTEPMPMTSPADLTSELAAKFDLDLGALIEFIQALVKFIQKIFGNGTSPAPAPVA